MSDPEMTIPIMNRIYSELFIDGMFALFQQINRLGIWKHLIGYVVQKGVSRRTVNKKLL